MFGGTATGLLETSFEAFAAFTTISVYKQQHQTLKQTLAWLTAAGAAAAIAAGITAAAAVHVGGFTAPFFISEIVCWLCLGAYILCRATGVHAPQVTPLQQISSPPSGLLGSFSISRGLPYIISSFVSLLASVVPAVCFCFSFLLRNTAACLSVLLQLCFESSLEVFVLFWPLLLIDLNSTQFTYLALNQQTSAIYKGKQTNDAADALLLWEQRGNGASLQNHFHKALKPADKLVNSSFPSSSTSSSYFSPLPLGLLFSCMMGAVAMGSFLFNFASTRLRLPLHLIIPASFLVASFSLFLCLSAATPLQLFFILLSIRTLCRPPPACIGCSAFCHHSNSYSFDSPELAPLVFLCFILNCLRRQKTPRELPHMLSRRRTAAGVRRTCFGNIGAIPLSGGFGNKIRKINPGRTETKSPATQLTGNTPGREKKRNRAHQTQLYKDRSTEYTR